jgi:hypothetical protein
MPATINKSITITKPVLVANRSTGPTVFTDESTNTEIRWEGCGDPNGADVQPVPTFMLENVNFLRALSRDTLEVIGGPDEVLEALAEHLEDPFLSNQAAAWHERRRDVEDEVNAHAQRLDTRDVNGLPCVGPGQRGGECGVLTPVRSTTVGDTPPLCNNHRHLAREFARTDGEVGANGKASVRWVRAVVARS